MAEQKALGERYRRHELREHALQLPDTYIGSVEPCPIETYVFDDTEGRMVKRQLIFVPGLAKIYDEIIVNATDQVERLKAGIAAATAGTDIRPVKNFDRNPVNTIFLPATLMQPSGVFCAIYAVDRHGSPASAIN